jgi:hypothetical protein
MPRTIIVGNATDSFAETLNFNFPIPGQDVHGSTLIEALDQAITEIDAALDTVADSAASSASSIGTIQTNVTTLTNTKKNIRPMPTSAAITRDVNGNITFYQTAEETLSNFVYTLDVLDSYRSTVNGVVYQVTLTRDGNDDITDIAVAVLP